MAIPDTSKVFAQLLDEFTVIYEEYITTGTFNKSVIEDLDKRIEDFNQKAPANARDLKGRMAVIKKNIDDIHRHYQKALLYSPSTKEMRSMNYATALSNYALIYLDAKVMDDAFAQFEKSFKLNLETITIDALTLSRKLLNLGFFNEALILSKAFFEWLDSHPLAKQYIENVKEEAEVMENLLLNTPLLESFAKRNPNVIKHSSKLFLMLLKLLAEKKFPFSILKFETDFSNVKDLDLINILLPVKAESIEQLYDLQDDFEVLKANYSINNKVDISSLNFQLYMMDELN